jgi:hypothetical protein
MRKVYKECLEFLFYCSVVALVVGFGIGTVLGVVCKSIHVTF